MRPTMAAVELWRLDFVHAPLMTLRFEKAHLGRNDEIVEKAVAALWTVGQLCAWERQVIVHRNQRFCAIVTCFRSGRQKKGPDSEPSGPLLRSSLIAATSTSRARGMFPCSRHL